MVGGLPSRPMPFWDAGAVARGMAPRPPAPKRGGRGGRGRGGRAASAAGASSKKRARNGSGRGGRVLEDLATVGGRMEDEESEDQDDNEGIEEGMGSLPAKRMRLKPITGQRYGWSDEDEHMEEIPSESGSDPALARQRRNGNGSKRGGSRGGLSSAPPSAKRKSAAGKKGAGGFGRTVSNEGSEDLASPTSPVEDFSDAVPEIDLHPSAWDEAAEKLPELPKVKWHPWRMVWCAYRYAGRPRHAREFHARRFGFLKARELAIEASQSKSKDLGTQPSQHTPSTWIDISLTNLPLLIFSCWVGVVCVAARANDPTLVIKYMDIHPDAWDLVAQSGALKVVGIRWNVRDTSWVAVIDSVYWKKAFIDCEYPPPIDPDTSRQLSRMKGFAARKYGYLRARQFAIDHLKNVRQVVEDRLNAIRTGAINPLDIPVPTWCHEKAGGAAKRAPASRKKAAEGKSEPKKTKSKAKKAAAPPGLGGGDTPFADAGINPIFTDLFRAPSSPDDNMPLSEALPARAKAGKKGVADVEMAAVGEERPRVRSKQLHIDLPSPPLPFPPRERSSQSVPTRVARSLTAAHYGNFCPQEIGKCYTEDPPADRWDELGGSLPVLPSVEYGGKFTVKYEGKCWEVRTNYKVSGLSARKYGFWYGREKAVEEAMGMHREKGNRADAIPHDDELLRRSWESVVGPSAAYHYAQRITFDPTSNMYVPRFHLNGKERLLGEYPSFDKAAMRWDEEAIRWLGHQGARRFIKYLKGGGPHVPKPSLPMSEGLLGGEVWDSYMDRDTNAFDVIVIGAGIAGLLCAKRLVKKGFKVIILEARDRMGGRISHVRLEGGGKKGGAADDEERTVEVGADYIYEANRDNPLYTEALEHRMQFGFIAGNGYNEPTDYCRYYDTKYNVALPFSTNVKMSIIAEKVAAELHEWAEDLHRDDMLPTSTTDLSRCREDPPVWERREHDGLGKLVLVEGRHIDSPLHMYKQRMRETGAASIPLSGAYEDALMVVLERLGIDGLTDIQKAVLDKIRMRWWGTCATLDQQSLATEHASWFDPGLGDLMLESHERYRAIDDDYLPQQPLAPRSADDPYAAGLRDAVERRRQNLDRRMRDLDKITSSRQRIKGGLLTDDMPCRLAVSGLTPFIEQRFDTVKPYIHCNRTVSRVTLRTSGAASGGVHCEVTTREGFEYRSRGVVCTVPVGVLQGSQGAAVDFQPPLSQDKQRAIGHLGMGCHEKVVLRFACDKGGGAHHIFWPSTTSQINTTDPRFQFTNMHAYGKHGVLVAHLYPPYSTETLPTQPDEQVLTDILTCLYKMFKPRIHALLSLPAPPIPAILDPDRQRAEIEKRKKKTRNKNRSKTPDAAAVATANSNAAAQMEDDVLGAAADIGDIDWPGMRELPGEAEDNKWATWREWERNEDARGREEWAAVERMRRHWLVGYHITRWKQDPFAQGSYPYLREGSSFADVRALAEPEASFDGRLFFAGDATEPRGFQTATGAWRSAVRATDQVHCRWGAQVTARNRQQASQQLKSNGVLPMAD
ncbi:unnamed protein product [Vitrella brassicaformis CCMP3155]|uniref:Amine oxidase domain-containing protein n=2 Tax=Vitrella brassicaformis TaxID=1169539 RepID=A0A0G4E932_VITBC|nr:unnamed protein product [Vitrella brassicaformis CCMP3155]|eukprot:CEL91715.1 unnamed protein product [Vitrella brassicaformis CCMP3155]